MGYQKWAPAIILAALAAVPLLVDNDYYLHLLILTLMWVVIGSAWNLLAGYTGQVSFGDAAFFGSGAYTSGLLVVHLGWSAWWGVPLGGVVAALIALPFGWICFRLRGAYFALATLALNEVMRHVATIWESLTQGMVGIMIMQTYISKTPYYYITLALAAFSVVSVMLVMRSKTGYYFISIREDPDAAESLGVDTHFYKMVSLTIAAALTGVAGGLYMNYMGFIDPHVVFSLHDISIMAILVGIVGGVGTIYGPAVGAFIMVLTQEMFRTGGFGYIAEAAKATGVESLMTAADYMAKAHVLGFGALVVIVIRFMPNGVVGDWGKIARRFSRRKGA
ncbi:MAG: branched-chain amino acid ABC transporter permease [Nitrospinae bacterium]|nr:branched-chain amino acid ABC transporter permease [Nitrospinota bacterium]